jgi:DNA-binding NarL/FixJ family response regulator
VVTTVMLVDDDPDVRRTLAAVIATDPGVELLAEAADGRAALALARQHRPDVVLLDIRMPGPDGLATLASLKRQAPPTRVVMLTTFGEGDYVRRAIADGADGFLLKAGDPHTLLAAIHGTAKGEAWLSPAVARFVADDLRRSAGDRGEAEAATRVLATLTDRERETAEHLARGLSNAEIGAALYLTESTVKAYLSSTMARTHTRNRVELAALVWRARPPGF